MTVQNLIDELMKIPEKDRELRLIEYTGNYRVRCLGNIYFEKTNFSDKWGYKYEAFAMMEGD